MTRYFVKSAHIATPDPEDGLHPNVLWQGDMATDITVHESIEETFTGLYDEKGNEIHVTRKGRLGF